jgi:hypothetical protein
MAGLVDYLPQLPPSTALVMVESATCPKRTSCSKPPARPARRVGAGAHFDLRRGDW